MREWKVNVVNAPNRYVLIAAESALEAEVLARRDGYSTFGMTVLWSGEDEGNEFEGMTPRQLRNAIRTLQEDLKRAVEDRRKLLEFVKLVYEESWEGMGDTTNRIHARGGTFIERMAGWEKFSLLCDEAAKIKAQVEGA